MCDRNVKIPLNKLDRFLLGWVADERGIDPDQIAEYIAESDGELRNLRYPVIPIALLQQILRQRWGSGRFDFLEPDNRPLSAAGSARSHPSPRRLFPLTRVAIHDFAEEVLAEQNSSSVLSHSEDSDETAVLAAVIRKIGGLIQLDDRRPNTLEAADSAVGQHCLTELDFHKLGAYSSNPILRELSSLSPLPSFISAKTRNSDILGVSGNPGDAFSIPAARYLSGRPVDPRGVWADADEPLLFTVGSVLQHVKNRGVTWGIGAINKLTKLPVTSANRSAFLAVRGPRTRDQVVLRWNQNPAVVSDPGLILPLVMEIPEIEPEFEVGYLPHGVDRQDFLELFQHEFVIDNYSGFQPLIDGILRCHRIVASSLHGMIFSHALGRPVALVNVDDRLDGGDFKFVDYLASIGVYCNCPRQSVMSLDTSHTQAIEHSSLQHLQTVLVAEFPPELTQRRLI